MCAFLMIVLLKQIKSKLISCTCGYKVSTGANINKAVFSKHNLKHHEGFNNTCWQYCETGPRILGFY